jgi:hypothetical protein
MTRKLFVIFSLASLFACLAAPILHFLGKMSAGTYKLIFVFASLGWFIFATLWAKPRKKV